MRTWVLNPEKRDAAIGRDRPQFLAWKILFGAIWCDLVRLGAIGGAEFKVQPGTGRGKNCRFGPPSGLIEP
jgi:hypothetical protein